MKTREILTGVALGVAVTATLLSVGCTTVADINSRIVQGDLRNGMDIVDNTNRIRKLERQVSNIVERVEVMEIVDSIEDIEHNDNNDVEVKLKKVEIPKPAQLKRIQK